MNHTYQYHPSADCLRHRARAAVAVTVDDVAGVAEVVVVAPPSAAVAGMDGSLAASWRFGRLVSVFAVPSVTLLRLSNLL